MDKSDLKTGMVIEFRNGYKNLVLIDSNLGNIYVRSNVSTDGNSRGHGCLSSFRSDLTHINNRQLDIVSVYDIEYNNLSLSSNIDDYGIIWERKPNIDIDIKINGKNAKLSDISEETLLKLREKKLKL